MDIKHMPGELHEVRASEGYERVMVADYIGHYCDGTATSPQVYLVDMVDPGSTIAPHFHTVSQFQLTVRGDGYIGKTAVPTACLHYADAYQPYGPIEAGESGLAYITIRARHDPGAKYMPASRHLRTHRPPRPHAVINLESADSMVDRESSKTLLGPFHDGLAVTKERVGPDQRVVVTGTETGDATVAVVLAGSLHTDGGEYARWSCAALSPGEHAEYRAGPEGVELLSLHFPLPPDER